MYEGTPPHRSQINLIFDRQEKTRAAHPSHTVYVKTVVLNHDKRAVWWF